MQRILSTYFLVVLLALSPLFSQPKHEMRAAWIATVANIDWPERNCFDVYQQQNHLVAILDSLQAMNFNTVIFQIRPTSDAFYQSDIEPWSRFLFGQQGVAPEPFYDPLAFLIYEAHKRQIDVHVWLNPYRVLNVDDIKLLSPNHIYFKQPQLFVKYGNQYYFNPGMAQTRQFLVDVVADVVTRYDIDAIHFDDYFYPYRIDKLDFPDQVTFQFQSRGIKNIEDWRRDNVNLVIQQLSQTIKSIKPWVEFGISPFGVWRNKSVDATGSDSRAGQTNYDDLYADVKLWLEKGWIDYVVPQLYWEIGKPEADYAKLVKWWSENSYDVNLYIGLSASKLSANSAAAWHKPNELCRQITLNRSYDQVSGAAFFSAKTLLENRLGLCDSLKNSYFSSPSINPICNNISGQASNSPTNLRVEKMGLRDYLVWDEVFDAGGYQIAYYLIYMFHGDELIDISNPKKIVCKISDVFFDLTKVSQDISQDVTFVVTSVNRFHQESEISNTIIYKQQKQ